MAKAKKQANIVWERAQDAFPAATLFGTKITPEDINQGFIGNCWFMSSCAALAELGDRIEKVFLNKTNEQNKAGIYGVNMYRLGVPATLVIDDFLPIRKSPTGGSMTLFASIGEDASLWGPFIEKSLAKFHGNYENIIAGRASVGVRTLSGAPYQETYHKEPNAPDQLFEDILKWDGKKAIMQAGTNASSNGKSKAENGIYYGHEYTVYSAHKLKSGQRLVRLRNPHGKDSYTGKWNDNDDESWNRLASQKERMKL